MLRTAEELRRVAEGVGIGIVYKSSFSKDNRSSLDYYRGTGTRGGLRILERIREEFGFPILSDVHTPDQATAAGHVLDIVQIPAYLCMQTELVVAAADTGKGRESEARPVPGAGEHDPAGREGAGPGQRTNRAH